MTDDKKSEEKQPHRVKIVSDGTPEGTKVVDEAGRPLENVSGIRWSIGVEGLASASIDLVVIEAEIEGLVYDVTPIGAPVRRFHLGRPKVEDAKG